MASITIKYTAPAVAAQADVTQICAMFWPNNSYVDGEVYDGTIWDTNVDGFGTWEGLEAYISSLSHTPNALIMFKAAVRDGEVTFEEADAKQVEFYKELGTALAAYGFEVSDEGAVEDEDDGE